jgi:hypothetical protein
MTKGEVYLVDKDMTYLLVDSQYLKDHFHLFPGPMKKKIVPVKKQNKHSYLKEGNKVDLLIQPINRSFLKMFYLTIPILSIITGFIIGNYFIYEISGIFILLLLFMLLGLNLKLIIKKQFNIFSEINTEIILSQG